MKWIFAVVATLVLLYMIWNGRFGFDTNVYYHKPEEAVSCTPTPTATPTPPKLERELPTPSARKAVVEAATASIAPEASDHQQIMRRWFRRQRLEEFRRDGLYVAADGKTVFVASPGEPFFANPYPCLFVPIPPEHITRCYGAMCNLATWDAKRDGREGFCCKDWEFCGEKEGAEKY